MSVEVRRNTEEEDSLLWVFFLLCVLCLFAPLRENAFMDWIPSN